MPPIKAMKNIAKSEAVLVSLLTRTKYTKSCNEHRICVKINIDHIIGFPGNPNKFSAITKMKYIPGGSLVISAKSYYSSKKICIAIS